MRQKDIETCCVEVKTGHYSVMISGRATKMYCSLTGSGIFKASGQCYRVASGILVEALPRFLFSSHKYPSDFKAVLVHGK